MLLAPLQISPLRQTPACTRLLEKGFACAQIEHAKEQHQKALKEAKQSEEQVRKELEDLQERVEADARKADRLEAEHAEDATKRVEVVKHELAQSEGQCAKLEKSLVRFLHRNHTVAFYTLHPPLHMALLLVVTPISSERVKVAIRRMFCSASLHHQCSVKVCYSTL